MRIFVAWHRLSEAGRNLDPARVTSALQRLHAPLFGTPPRARVLESARAALVLLELPVQGWKASFFEEDDGTWALALDYPIGARAVLAARGIRPAGALLPALARALQEDPRPVLSDLAPPFSLVWSTGPGGDLCLQNDGLGQSQLFEYDDDRLWAVSNKVAAFQALGASLRMQPEQWAVRSTLGWFPQDTSGYQHVRFLAPATQLRIGARGVERRSWDVLSGWLHPEPMSRDDCLERARGALLAHLEAVAPLCRKPSASLSGGWDSRAVVASLRRLGVEFSARVRGLPTRPDVTIAAQLAEIAGLRLRVKASGGLPPEDTEACRRSILLALRWQAGAMVTHKHKTFLASRRHLDGGVVNIMGQHGEIGRQFYAQKIAATGWRPEGLEERLVRELLARMPSFTRAGLVEPVRQMIRDAYRQADRYDLEGSSRLDFFYLYERTRRWASGSLASQTGVVVTPFLNPNYIRAVFGLRDRGDDPTAFHRHIIARHAPDWDDVRYSEELEEAGLAPGALGSGAERGSAGTTKEWRRPTGKYNYDSSRYWEAVARPLLHEALEQGGPWTEVFDPDAARRGWRAAPDELAILHLLPEMLAGGEIAPSGEAGGDR